MQLIEQDKEAIETIKKAINLGYKSSYPYYAEKCAVHVCKAVDGVRVFEGVL